MGLGGGGGGGGEIGGIIGAIGSIVEAATTKSPKPRQHQFQAPAWEQAFRQYFTQLLARNLTNQPPSFQDYIRSGGTATFPISDPGLSPLQARRLGLTGAQGTNIPYVQPGQTSLTPEQQLYLGFQQALLGKTTPETKAYQKVKKERKKEGLTPNPFKGS